MAERLHSYTACLVGMAGQTIHESNQAMKQETKTKRFYWHLIKTYNHTSFVSITVAADQPWSLYIEDKTLH